MCVLLICRLLSLMGFLESPTGILLAKKAARITQPSLMPEALGAGLVLSSSLPRAVTGLGLSGWIRDSWCPVSPKSKARGRAVWIYPEPGDSDVGGVQCPAPAL